MNTIELKNIEKRFGANYTLKNINLKFEDKKIYGLLGRNGAGKSTILNIINHRIFPNSGQIFINEKNTADQPEQLRNIYYATETNIYPKLMKVKNIFSISETFYPNFDMHYALELASQFELNINKSFMNLSTGYKTICKNIVALASNCQILIFDEPVSGLDAYHRDLFYKEVLNCYNKKPKTMILSTHLIDEISNILEHVIIVNNGEIIENISSTLLQEKYYTITGELKKINEYIIDKEVISESEMSVYKTVTLKGLPTPQDVDLQEELNLNLCKTNLQELFIHLTNQSFTF